MEAKTVAIQQLLPFDARSYHASNLVKETVEVYRKVFGGSPWNEGYKCPVCNGVYALDYQHRYCPKCGEFDCRCGPGAKIPLVEFWPTSQVMTDFYSQMKKNGALCLVAVKSQGVIGFTWGYELSVSADVDEHLEAPGLHKIIVGEYFYLDEVGVLPGYQKQGIGKKLLEKLFLKQGRKPILLRTLKESPMRRLIEKMGGKIVLEISRDRVIMTLAV